jgi:predicted nucleic acid-binding Zn ribbon protein
VPVYEYQCDKGHRYEKQESFGAAAEQPCDRPRCKATAHRLIISPQVHFRGSGWYKTDSRKNFGPPLNADAVAKQTEVSASQIEADTAERPPFVKKDAKK